MKLLITYMIIKQNIKLLNTINKKYNRNNVQQCFKIEIFI